MTGLYIFGGLVLAGFAALIFYKVRWGRASKKESNRLSDNIAKDRVEEKSRESKLQ